MLSSILQKLRNTRPLDFFRRQTRAVQASAAAALAVSVLCFAWAVWPSPRPVISPPLPPSVGTENQASILIPRKDCFVAPQSPSTPLLLRIANITPAENGQFRYQLLFSGLERGTFNLTDYLVTPDGERLREPVETVTVRSLISPPVTYSALELDAPSTKRPTPYFGILIFVALAWSACGFFLFRNTLYALLRFLFKFRKKTSPASDPQQESAPAPPTLADILRPLIEKAAQKTITTEEKSRLEQIIFLYWGEFLEIEYLDSVEQLRRILEHPTAGELLRTVEQWLYQPESLITKEEITAALNPYMDLPATLVLHSDTPASHAREEQEHHSNGNDESAENEDEDARAEKSARQNRKPAALLATSK